MHNKKDLQQTADRIILERLPYMKKILIAEDDAISARVYRMCLESAGFEVQVAADGQAAIEKIAENPPDALLLDLMMPRMNGVDVLKHLRSMPQFQTLPVMVYTNAYAKLGQEAVDAGATRVFDKSKLTPAILLEALRGATRETSEPSS